MNRGQLFIDGKWKTGRGNVLKSTNPSDESVLWEGVSADEGDVERAMVAAEKSFKSWSKTSLEMRTEIIQKYTESLKNKKDELANLISCEMGKPIWEATLEVSAMIGKTKISIKAFHDRCADRKSEIAGGLSMTRFRPIGVVAVFGPFNLPGHLPNGHIIPALLAGNAIVFKPSEQTPFVGEWMAKRWEEAGLPKGVFNLVQGSKETGIALSKHPTLNGLFFTGSYQVGRILHESFAGHPEKMLALEMGGNNPLLVWDCEDIDAIVYTIIQSAFITSGQRCVCARRLILEDNSKGKKILESLIEHTKKITVALPTEFPEPFMGPLVSKASADQVLASEAKLIQLGGQSMLRMSRGNGSKALFSPGIVTLSSDLTIPDEEVFGPLLQVTFTKNFNRAIEMANHTTYGLSAGLISDDPKKYGQFLSQSNAGIINWNRQITGASSASPFGGTGRSGNFRPSAYFAADYCSYPVASIECDTLTLPEKLTPGLRSFQTLH